VPNPIKPFGFGQSRMHPIVVVMAPKHLAFGGAARMDDIFSSKYAAYAAGHICCS
jgi:hypothetical protein